MTIVYTIFFWLVMSCIVAWSLGRILGAAKNPQPILDSSDRNLDVPEPGTEWLDLNPETEQRIRAAIEQAVFDQYRSDTPVYDHVAAEAAAAEVAELEAMYRGEQR
jgi:hypothetical protein